MRSPGAGGCPLLLPLLLFFSPLLISIWQHAAAASAVASNRCGGAFLAPPAPAAAAATAPASSVLTSPHSSRSQLPLSMAAAQKGAQATPTAPGMVKAEDGQLCFELRASEARPMRMPAVGLGTFQVKGAAAYDAVAEALRVGGGWCVFRCDWAGRRRRGSAGFCVVCLCCAPHPFPSVYPTPAHSAATATSTRPPSIGTRRKLGVPCGTAACHGRRFL